MSWSLILVCVSFLLFIIYNSVAIGLFGIPFSLSHTYYLYENKKKGLGWIFTIFMWVMAFTLAPGFIETSLAVGPWMSNFTFLSFITVAGLAFVGTAPRYRLDFESVVHTVSAAICAISALLWCFIVCWNIWYVPLIVAIIPITLGFITKTWKSGRDYWLEMMAFDATFLTIILENIIYLM